MVAFGGLSFGNTLSEDDGNDIRVSLGLKFVPKVWSKPRKLFKPTEIQSSVSQSYFKNNICKQRFVFGSTNTIVARFGHNFSQTSASSESMQDVINKIINRIDDVESIKVVGHTSTIGTDEYNLELSTQRASTIKKILIDNGVPANVIQIKGQGEQQLLVSPEKSLKDQRQNRRTEFQVKLKSKYKYKDCY